MHRQLVTIPIDAGDNLRRVTGQDDTPRRMYSCLLKHLQHLFRFRGLVDVGIMR
jgi:hypothetical protein